MEGWDAHPRHVMSNEGFDMLGMKRLMLALGTVAVLGVGDMGAQEPPAPRGEGMHRGPAPETILAFRDRLGLTEDQVTALEEVRERMVAVCSSHRAAMAQLRSRFQAGEIDRAEMLGSMEAIRSGGPDLHQELQDRIQAILDEGQLAAVQQLRADRDATRGCRGQMRPGRGMRGGDGAMSPGRDMRGGERPGGMRGRGMRGGDRPGGVAGRGMRGGDLPDGVVDGPGAPGGPGMADRCSVSGSP